MLAVASAFMAGLIVGAVAVVGVLILIAVFISDAAQSCEDIGEEGAEGEIVGARGFAKPALVSDQAAKRRLAPTGFDPARIAHSAADNPKGQHDHG